MRKKSFLKLINWSFLWQKPATFVQSCSKHCKRLVPCWMSFFLWPYYLVFLKMTLQWVQSLFVNLCPLEFVGEYLCSSIECFTKHSNKVINGLYLNYKGKFKHHVQFVLPYVRSSRLLVHILWQTQKTRLHFHTWLNVTIELFGDCKKTFETNMASFVGYIYFYIVSSIRVNTE